MQKMYIEVWWNPGGKKNKGNTHQDSCIVLYPTFPLFPLSEAGGGNPPVFHLFQLLAPSKRHAVHLQAATM